MKTIKGLLLAGMIGFTGLLAGCGGGGAGGTTSTSTTSGTSTAASVSLSPSDPATGNVSNTLSSGTPLTLTVLVRDTAGAVVPNMVVTFTTDAQYGTFNPVAGTALTNASGIASVTLNAGSKTGAATVTASALVGTATITNSVGYSVNVAALGLGSLSFGINPLSAYGTTSVAVNVTSGGVPYLTPVDVAFTSDCKSVGKADIPGSVRSVNGVATASYRDIACGATDLVTASIASGASSAASLVVNQASISSIQFVSASPTNISVQGMGGTEVSTVKFKVLDSGGNPISGQTVNFSLNTSVGGLHMTASSGVSDVTGEVQTQVVSGTVLTPVRVTATTTGVGAVSSQSSMLYVSTMIPDQAHFSLSATELPLEALETDGVSTTVTARLGDRFGNPVPDGTAVVFTAEGGVIQSGCTTTGGKCDVVWTSQDPRPGNGRATILAYAVGEESFIDANGNGRFDTGEAIIEDLGEAYRDDNGNGSFDFGSDLPIDFNSDGSLNTADTLFTGTLCNTSCSAASSLHVRGSLVLTFSGSTPIQPISIISPRTIDLGGSAGAGAIVPVTLTVMDVNNNSMPAGTTITAVTTNGKLVGVSVFTIPANGEDTYTLYIQNDASGTPVSDPTSTGTLTVTVKTPGNIETSDVVSVIN